MVVRIGVRTASRAWNVLLVVFILFAWVSLISTKSASASSPGINVTVYNNFGYNASPPLPTQSGRPQVGTTTLYQINQSFDQTPLFGMYEDFIVKYEGYITSPVSGNVLFWPWADDGTKFFIDGVLVDPGNWVDKGGGGYQATPQMFTGGVSRQFTYWYYENGGGANTSLYWDIGNGWEIVPESAFTRTPAETTTTTLAPYLNPPQNLVVSSVNETKVYLEWDEPEDSNANIERYAVFWSCDNWETGFAISSLITSAVVEGLEPDSLCSFRVRADNDTSSTYSSWSNEVQGRTSATTTTTTTTSPPVIPPETTQPVQTTVPPETTTTTEKPKESTTTVKPQAVPSTSLQTTTTISPTTTSIQTTTTTVVEEKNEKKEEIQNKVEEEIKEGITPDKAVELLSSDDVIENITEEQAEEIFKSIDVEEMTEQQVAQVIEAVQDAPKEIRETFEDTVDLFDGGFDDYKMVDSNISVGERRTVIAVNLVTASVATAAMSTGGTSGGPGGTGGGSGGGGGGGGSSPNAGGKRNEEDEESEMAGEIAGDGYDWVSKISIYKIKGEERVLDWKAFIKKFILGILNLSFTIAGSVVVYFTLSGSIQKIALVSTLVALAASMYLHMKEPES